MKPYCVANLPTHCPFCKKHLVLRASSGNERTIECCCAERFFIHLDDPDTITNISFYVDGIDVDIYFEEDEAFGADNETVLSQNHKTLHRFTTAIVFDLTSGDAIRKKIQMLLTYS